MVGGGLLQPPCGETASGKALYFTGNTSSRSVELGFSTADLGNLGIMVIQYNVCNNYYNAMLQYVVDTYMYQALL